MRRSRRARRRPQSIDSAAHQPPFRRRKRRRGIAAGARNEGTPLGAIHSHTDTTEPLSAIRSA